MAHSNPAPFQGAYSSSKAAFASLLQHIAEEIPAEKAQIFNVHPGAIQTTAEGGEAMGLVVWDNGKFPTSPKSCLRNKALM